MFYYLVRIIIFLVIFLTITFINIRKKSFDKKNIIRYFLIVIAGCLISFYMPVEYSFLKYSSIEKAFSYGHNSNSFIKVIQNDDMAVAIYTRDNKSISFFPLNKDDDTWRINPLNSFYLQSRTYKTNIIYEVSFPTQTKTFIFIMQPSFILNTPKISDSHNSQFSPITFSLSNIQYGIYYSIVPTPDQNYIITVNGESFTLK